MRDWLDHRTGFRGILKDLLEEPLPSGTGWWFVTGSIVMFLLTVQLVTGVLLAIFYSPSPDHAYDSIRFIMERVTFGRVLRGLHFFGASFIVIAAVVHMLRVMALGSYKKPRELNWVIGVLLLLIILGFALTGYLLPWDQKAYWATTVTLNIARSTPLVGNFVSGLLRGGTGLGALTLMRWYAAHVFLLPFIDTRPERAPRQRPVVIGSFIFVFAMITLLTVQGFRTTPSPAAQSPQAIAQGRARAAGQTRGPVMVEDVFKNVQVLKGITVDEFMGTMGLMSSSLGLCCNDCHPGAGTDKVVWESDENPRKVRAREMASMVQAINRDNFNGQQVVTCWTCHRLRLTPVQTPVLDRFYAEAESELDDQVSKGEGVPSPAQMLDKYLQALGGADKVMGINTITGTGKVVAFGSFGGGGNFEYFAQAPDKRAMLSHLPDGESSRTFDGRTGWFAIPLAVVPKYPLTGGELDGARIDAQLAFPANIAHALSGLRVGPVTELNGKFVYLLQGNGARGSFVSMYFDMDSGLLLRTIRYTPSKIGKVPTQVDYENWRVVNGIKFPFKWTFTWLDGRDSFDFTDVKFNVPIDAAKFGEPVLTRVSR